MPTPTPTKVFDTYWRFAAERQNVFFARLVEPWADNWTDDAILRQHKFTNAYRAADRVSQYLIRSVIYEGDLSPDEVFFRTMLFKVFNRIETWELLTTGFGGNICWADFDADHCNCLLTDAMAAGKKVFSAAYIMPAGVGNPCKHAHYVALLERMMKDGLPRKIADCRRLADVFRLICDYPSMGNFLAFQYAIDLNYGPVIAISEDDYVVAGPGAISGISKCFSDMAGLSPADIIRWVTDTQEDHFARLGLPFKNLFGRRLHLIDCQNLFCETNKYARIAHPDVHGADGRDKIKQTFRPLDTPVAYWFPPKWGINHNIPSPAVPRTAAAPCEQGSLFSLVG